MTTETATSFVNLRALSTFLMVACLTIVGCDTASVAPTDGERASSGEASTSSLAEGSAPSSFSAQGLSVASTESGGASRLSFDSKEAASDYMNYLKGQDDLTSVEEQYADFVSKRTRQEQIRAAAEGNGSIQVRAPIEDPGLEPGDPTPDPEPIEPALPDEILLKGSEEFLSMLNADGEVQIGDRIFKVTRDYVYEASESEATLLEEVDGSQSQHSELEVHEVQYSTSATTGGENEPTCEVYAGPDYRMQGAIEYNNYWFFAEARVATRWQREAGWWIWTYWKM